MSRNTDKEQIRQQAAKIIELQIRNNELTADYEYMLHELMMIAKAPTSFDEMGVLSCDASSTRQVAFMAVATLVARNQLTPEYLLRISTKDSKHD